MNIYYTETTAEIRNAFQSISRKFRLNKENCLHRGSNSGLNGDFGRSSFNIFRQESNLRQQPLKATLLTTRKIYEPKVQLFKVTSWSAKLKRKSL